MSPRRKRCLDDLRTDAGFSKTAFAEAAGLTPQAVRDIELRVTWPKLNVARDMAVALDVTLDELVDAIDESKKRAGH